MKVAVDLNDPSPEEPRSDRDVLSNSLSKSLVDTLIPKISNDPDFRLHKEQHLSSKVHFNQDIDVKAGALPVKDVPFIPLELAMEYVRKAISK